MVLIIVEILIPLLNKCLMVLFVMSFLLTFRHLYYFIQSIIKSTEEEPVNYKLTSKSLLILGLSISYIITSMLIGIKL